MFRTWCRKQGFSNGSNLSHVLMDGGVLSVPFDRLNEFYEEYVKAVKSGEKVFVVEQKTDTYNFFVDLDYKDDEDIPFERLEEYTQTICDRVTHFGGKDVLISVAEPKPYGDTIKYGIHMNWPGFVVDHESAMALHSHIVSSLSIMFPGKSWNDIVDTAVYGGGKRNVKGSGFRMPWSHKRAKHDTCGGRGCDQCEKGRVTQGEYRPVIIYSHESGKMEHIFDQEPSVDIMHMTTLRTENTEVVVVEGSKRDEGTFTLKETKNVFQDERVYKDLELFIQKNMDGQGSAQVTKMYGDKHAFLVSTTSKYCENLRREHASNHVWFRIEGHVITQKCFCTCETMKGRRYGFCKDFYGRKHTLTTKIFEQLYPKGYTPPLFSPPQNVCTPCPEEKKVDSVELSELLKSFINRHMVGDKTVRVASITKKTKHIQLVNTDFTCTDCKKGNTQFKISKKRILQVCSCKPREHNLSDKISRLL